MRIAREVTEYLRRHTAGAPREIGGILGSRDGEVISDAFVDYGGEAGRCCAYRPNVAMLNAVLAEWQTRGIAFRGIFHSHFAGVRTLSAADLSYIERIMHAMPEEIRTLYFPICVLPEGEVIGYAAERRDGVVTLREEAVTVVAHRPNEIG